MSKKTRKQEDHPTNMLDAESAYCAVDNTKCNGSCQAKSLENGFVFCSEAIPASQAMSLREKRKRGLARKRRRFQRDDEDEYNYDD